MSAAGPGWQYDTTLSRVMPLLAAGQPGQFSGTDWPRAALPGYGKLCQDPVAVAGLEQITLGKPAEAQRRQVGGTGLPI